MHDKKDFNVPANPYGEDVDDTAGLEERGAGLGVAGERLLRDDEHRRPPPAARRRQGDERQASPQ